MVLAACLGVLAPLGIAGAGAGASASAGAATRAEILARVDGDTLALPDLDGVLAVMTQPGNAAAPLPAADAILRRLIQNRLLEHEGYRIGADQTAEVTNQIREFVRTRSVGTLLDSVAASAAAPDPRELDSLLALSSTMRRLSQIVLPDEAPARRLQDSLAAGVAFADLARRHSIDTLTAPVGGDIGWGREGAYLPVLENALAGLAPGGISQPFQTPRGWYIVKVTETRVETSGQSDRMREALREAIVKERGKRAVKDYVASLKTVYNITVDDSLLASLDYASAAPEVQAYLRTSDAALCTLPTGRLTVRGLTRNIRFQYFHGTEGRADAAQIRDRMFDQWVSEGLLTYAAASRGLDRRPEVTGAARQLERDLIREAVIAMIVEAVPAPAPAQVESLYAADPDRFAPQPRVKVRGVLLESEAAAAQFRRSLAEGATINWLSTRAPGVRDAHPAALSDWLDAATLGTGGSTPAAGAIVGPVKLGEDWVVAEVVEIEPAAPAPLSECRDRVAAALKGDRVQAALTSALSRLEAAAKIEIEKGAIERITDRVRVWQSTTPAGTTRP